MYNIYLTLMRYNYILYKLYMTMMKKEIKNINSSNLNISKLTLYVNFISIYSLGQKLFVCTARFFVKSFSRKFSWNSSFHGKIEKLSGNNNTWILFQFTVSANVSVERPDVTMNASFLNLPRWLWYVLFFLPSHL